MSEAPANALVLKARCPICDEETITCKFWSEYTWDTGWEGDGDARRTCNCPSDGLGYMRTKDGYVSSVDDICCAAFDQHVGEEREKRRETN